MSADVVLVNDVQILGNGAVNVGGGAYIDGTTSTIRRTIIQGNGFPFSLPIGPFTGPGLYLKGETCLVDSVQSVSNGAFGYFDGPAIAGGGICSLCSSLLVRNSRITDNVLDIGEKTVAIGGGIYADGDSLVVENTIIARNKCIYGYGGGGVYAGKCRLVDCEIIDNESNGGKMWGSGGGVSAGYAEIVRSLIQGNYCAGQWGADGGGIYAGALTIRNSVVSGNSVSNLNSPNSGRGAGIVAYTLDAANIIVRDNSCFVNWPAEGMGIYLGNGTIRSSIISDHSSSDAGEDRGVIFGNLQSISNLFFNNEPVLFAGGNVDSSGHVHADPLFADVAGGDLHLLLHSPAIDRGDPADLDPDGSRADIGAFGGPGAIMSQLARVEGAEGISGYGNTLKWTAVTAPDLVGYAIYRADAPGIHPGAETILDLPKGVGTSYVDLSAIPNTTYFYRVSAYDASGYGGGYSDELEVTAVPWFGEGGDGGGRGGTSAATLPPKVDRLSLTMRGANPAQSRADFELALPQAGQVELSVYDISGRRVWNEVRVLEAGYHGVQWKGTWQDGSRVAAGTYFVKARSAGEASIQRVVLLR